jgi:hypothetical protein
MKFTSAIFAGALVLAASTPVLAQQQQQQQQQAPNGMQAEQQACEGDVYKLCGQAIPDQTRIEKCLRKKWSKVSQNCRKTMASYGKRHNGQEND